MAVAACAGIVVGLLTSGDAKDGRAGKTTTTRAAAPATLTLPGFTASRVGVACRTTSTYLVCSRAGAGRVTLTTAGKVKIERRGDSIEGGPALAPGQDWKAIGLRCREKSGGLECLADGRGSGFFVDADGFVER
jgi:hypothetical protein